MPRASTKYSMAATPHKSPIKVPLNDDRQEKASRRQALHDAQRNSLRASATPNRRRISLAAHSPHTPAHDQDDDMPDVAGTAVTPMKRVMPLLANFEEWMKLATDNKINATNSWNFALIDYFHDMSLLKEGDGVNFQKASCTLDGCVKIYTSRVDSVATDTGKLLSGLAESGQKKRRGQDAEGDGEDEDGEEGEDGQKKRKKRAARSAEATLATSFAQLQNKKMELDLSVDPLFKKASADFDEGGAKGLLLNHLAIDPKGRIVFDSSDDVQDASAEDSRATPGPEDADARLLENSDIDQENEEVDIDISGLGAKYFPDLARLDEQDVCPSLKTLDLGNADGSMDLPFLKAKEDWQHDDENKAQDDDEGNRSGLFLDENNAAGFDDDLNLGASDFPAETGFGEGGEMWAKEAAIVPQDRVHTIEMGEGDEEVGEGAGTALGGEGTNFGLSMTHGRAEEQENILSYFDQALKKNWAGPEHWRIRRIKGIGKAPPTVKRKEKEPFEIDFSAPMAQSLADILYTPAASNSTISLPRAQWKSKSRNLLPDDKHFNSKQLLRLFLKPKARMGSRRQGTHVNQQVFIEPAGGEVDEAYWAQRESAEHASAADEDLLVGNYDADFFQDDGLPNPGAPLDDDDEFVDARDHVSPPAEEIAGQALPIDGVLPSTQEGAFGTQLVTQSRRIRPEYLEYAKTAKKVDVRRLKEELWKGIGFEGIQAPPDPGSEDNSATKAVNGTMKFTRVMDSLQTIYPKQQMRDISTSYCFICLLHLANEKGLVIDNQENFEDLSIRKDFTADLSVGAD